MQTAAPGQSRLNRQQAGKFFRPNITKSGHWRPFGWERA